MLKNVDRYSLRSTIRYSAADRSAARKAIMRRFGQVIKVKPESEAAYKRYHSAVWPEVAEMIRACNIQNYSIYLKDGFLFSYFEYIGNDFESDMTKMGADPKTQEWWAVVKPLQSPLATRLPGEWWADMEEVFHQD